MARDKICTPFLALASPENKFTVSTIEDMQSRKYLKIGDVVDLLGYYTAGDGAGHKRKIEAADDGSGVQLANGLWANIVHNGEVNVEWFGFRGYDNVEIIARTIEYTRNNIHFSIPNCKFFNIDNMFDGLSVISKIISLENINIIFQSNKYYYLSKWVHIKDKKSVKITSSNNSKANIINGSFAIIDCEYVDISNINFESYRADVAIPPNQITANESLFNTGNYWWYEDWRPLGYSGDGIQLRATKNQMFKECNIYNCSAHNRTNLFVCDLSSELEGPYIETVNVSGCSTYSIWWHGVGTRNTFTATITGNTFNTHWVGLGVDLSSQTKRAIVDGNIIKNTCGMIKTQSRYSSDSPENYKQHSCENIISNNIFTSPQESSYNHNSGYVVNLAGGGNIFSGNILHIYENYNHFILSNGSENKISNNKYIISDGVVITNLYTLAQQAKSDLKLSIDINNDSIERQQKDTNTINIENMLYLGGANNSSYTDYNGLITLSDLNFDNCKFTNIIYNDNRGVKFSELSINNCRLFSDKIINIFDGFTCDNIIFNNNYLDYTTTDSFKFCNVDNKFLFINNTVNCYEFNIFNLYSKKITISGNNINSYKAIGSLFRLTSVDSESKRTTIDRVELLNNTIKYTKTESMNVASLLYIYDGASTPSKLIKDSAIIIMKNNHISADGYDNSVFILLSGAFTTNITENIFYYTNSVNLYFYTDYKGIGMKTYQKNNLSTTGFSIVGALKKFYYLDDSNPLSAINLDTPYHATKMQQEGVYEDFIQYMDSKTEYDRLQREQPEDIMMLSAIEEPQPSEALLKFKEKYLG